MIIHSHEKVKTLSNCDKNDFRLLLKEENFHKSYLS